MDTAVSRDYSIVAPCRIYTEKDVTDPVFIARGGFGDIIKYRHRIMTTEVVVKKAKDLSHEEQHRKESRLHFSIQHHPNIVQVYGFLHYDDGSRGIMMEYLNEGNLNKVIHAVIVDRMKRQFVYDASHVIKWTMDITSAIHFIHKRFEIVHLDLKPGNLLLYNDRTAIKLTDFGISFSIQEGKNRKGGTVPYMAPEVWKKEACLKSDIYSIGIILWQLIHRSAPWPPNYTEFMISEAVSQGKRPKIACNCVPDLINMVQRCWSAEIDERWNAESLYDELDSLRTRNGIRHKVTSIRETEPLVHNSILSLPAGTRVTAFSRASSSISSSSLHWYEEPKNPKQTHEICIDQPAQASSQLLVERSPVLANVNSETTPNVQLINSENDGGVQLQLAEQHTTQDRGIGDANGKSTRQLFVRHVHYEANQNINFAAFAPSTSKADMLAVGFTDGRVIVVCMDSMESKPSHIPYPSTRLTFDVCEPLRIVKLKWNESGSRIAVVLRAVDGTYQLVTANLLYIKETWTMSSRTNSRIIKPNDEELIDIEWAPADNPNLVVGFTNGFYIFSRGDLVEYKKVWANPYFFGGWLTICKFRFVVNNFMFTYHVETRETTTKECINPNIQTYHRFPVGSSQYYFVALDGSVELWKMESSSFDRVFVLRDVPIKAFDVSVAKSASSAEPQPIFVALTDDLLIYWKNSGTKFYSTKLREQFGQPSTIKYASGKPFVMVASDTCVAIYLVSNEQLMLYNTFLLPFNIVPASLSLNSRANKIAVIGKYDTGRRAEAIVLVRKDRSSTQ